MSQTHVSKLTAQYTEAATTYYDLFGRPIKSDYETLFAPLLDLLTSMSSELDSLQLRVGALEADTSL